MNDANNCNLIVADDLIKYSVAEDSDFSILFFLDFRDHLAKMGDLS